MSHGQPWFLIWRGVAVLIGAIWLFLIVGGVVAAAAGGQIAGVTTAAFAAGKSAMEVLLTLAPLMALWLGLMRIAEKSGLMEGLARLLRPVIGWLFPSLPPDHPALGPIVANLSANILGLGGAATPLGLNAMQALQEGNPDRETASEAMCTFLALNTACITLVPGSVIALRAAAGAAHPADIVGPTLIATCVAAAVGVAGDWLCRRRAAGRRRL